MQTIYRADMGTQIFDGNITSTIDAQQPSEYVFVWIYATSGVWAPSVYLTRVFNCCDRVLPTRRSCETLAGSSVVVHFNECAAYHLLAVRRNSDTPTPICKCHAMCNVMRLIREWHHRFPRTTIASAKPLAQFVSANMKLSLFSLVLGGLNRALRLTKAYNSSSSMGNTDRQLYYTCNKNKMSKSLLRKSCGLEKWWH